MKHLLYLHGRAARSALRTLVRQPLGSLLSLFMLAVAISLPLGLYLIVASLSSWSNGLAAAPQITLFMEASADRPDVETVNQTLKQHALVKSHRFVSKEQALQDLMKRNSLNGLTEGLGSNPLPDAFIVDPKDTAPEPLERLQKELSGLPMVEATQFDAGWAKKLHSLLSLGHQLTLLLGAALGIAMVLASSNTIRLQILARRNEIEVSKLIGATDGFIRRPFMYFAVFQGVLAALVAWGLSAWLIATANPAVAELAALYNNHATLRQLAPEEVAALLLGVATLAALGARLATGHVLREMEPS